MLQALRLQSETIGQEWDTSSVRFVHGAAEPQLFKVRLCWPGSLLMWAYAASLWWNGSGGRYSTSENSQPS